MAGSSGVKTDEKKQHFDDIYVESTPVPYKEKILDALSYVSDDFNKSEFDRLILDYATNLSSSSKRNKVNFVDLCACFGNTTMATLYGMGYEDIRKNWSTTESCRKINKSRRFDAHVTAIDISEPAMSYGKSVGLYDETIVADLNSPSPENKARVVDAFANADIFICTAALVYLDPSTIEYILDGFCKHENKDGYVMVNFLNPFALEKADATKRMLLSKLDFVGSRATRHRKLSELERNNYPGEDWALLEIWILRRRGGNGSHSG